MFQEDGIVEIRLHIVLTDKDRIWLKDDVMNATITRATKRTLGRYSLYVIFSFMLMITADGHARLTCTRFWFPWAKIQIENQQSLETEMRSSESAVGYSVCQQHAMYGLTNAWKRCLTKNESEEFIVHGWWSRSRIHPCNETWYKRRKKSQNRYQRPP